MTKSILLATTLLIATTGLFAQSQITASGGEASGSGGTASYSIGQTVYQTNNGNGGTVTEGLQQAYEIYSVTGVENTEIVLTQVSAYPNPVKHYLRLEVEMESVKDLSFQLYDIQGKVLQNQKLLGSEIQIDMSKYKPSSYFLIVISGNHSIKEFKIIKN